MLRKPNRYLCLFLIFTFTFFTLDGTTFARGAYPQKVNVQFTIKNAQLHMKRVGKTYVPDRVLFNGRSFKLVKRGKKYGIRAKNSLMANAAPIFKERLDHHVGTLCANRIRQLTKGNRVLAQKVLAASKNKKSASRGKGRSYSRQGKSSAASSLASQVNRGYNQVMGKVGFFETRIVPRGPAGTSAGGWAFVNENENTNVNNNSNNAANTNAANNSTNEDEEEDNGTLIGFLITLLVVTVVTLAPIAAAIWLVAQPLTLLSVFTAVSGIVVSTTTAAVVHFGVTTLEDLVLGNPLGIVRTNESESWENPFDIDDWIASDEFQQILAEERERLNANGE